MEVNGPLVFHFRRDEERTVSEDTVDRKPQSNLYGARQGGFNAYKARSVILGEGR
jgi:hypothetical protein